MDWPFFVFVAALAIGLNQADTAKRWLKGEDVFAAA